MEQRSDSLDGFGRGIYVHTFEFAGFDPAAGLRRFLGFRRLLFLLSSLFVDGVIVRPHGLPLRLQSCNIYHLPAAFLAALSDSRSAR